jgi:hypothetical protein
MDLFPHQKKTIEFLKNAADTAFFIQRTEPLPTDQLSVVIAKKRPESSGKLKLIIDCNKSVLSEETDKK